MNGGIARPGRHAVVARMKRCESAAQSGEGGPGFRYRSIRATGAATSHAASSAIGIEPCPSELLLGFGDHLDRLPGGEPDCLCSLDQFHCFYALLSSSERANERLLPADALVYL